MKNKFVANRSASAFSFLEVLVAVSLSALLFTAGTSLLFSFFQIWAQVETEPRFERHIDGVSRFLQYCFDHSANLSGDLNRPMIWQNPPEGTRPALHFRIEEPAPFFVSEVKPYAAVDAFLRFHEDEGLSLIWHHQPEFTENRLQVRRTPVSPFVSAIEFGYYDPDEEEWEFKVATEESSDVYETVPEMIRLTFRQNSREYSTLLPLTRSLENVTTY